MRAIRDFPAVDALSPGDLLTFDMGDFLNNSGLTLMGSPSVTATVIKGIDAGAQSKVSSVVIGTPTGPVGSGVTNGAIQCVFTGGIGDVVYLLYAKASTNRAGVYAELWAHLPCKTPN